MKKTQITPLAIALGTALTLGVATSVSAAENPFSSNSLESGYKVAMEGKCGEGKCGVDKKSKEGSCGEDKKAKEDKKVKEGKCGEGKCGADKKAKEGSYGGDIKSKEGKCGGDT
jgi:uncharacterized low-complexity protein